MGRANLVLSRTGGEHTYFGCGPRYVDPLYAPEMAQAVCSAWQSWESEHDRRGGLRDRVCALTWAATAEATAAALRVPFRTVPDQYRKTVPVDPGCLI